ncbi:class I SAM-dependent methyltransferase [Spirilliplanes yamanashiensis]|uniref:Putative methyltransferase n=1 Tax=Spirilliplanes yamanashiensis TaxID=42233 RepID=A0A8J4DJS4_9ACTN|nr:class I SAM-dependent methyltransferase [Spirilliplanes yamanashiensis]MDP9817687.1 SAM-dependent methyltransferase [Spirilliplanes yamanashiensis]GIJ04497.1 putative methyltransferase [Spirilliplanes yamanashiensis]
MASSSSDHGYDDVYRSGAPWEIGGPQPALAAVLDEVRGPAVLDAGCGTGELALALARRGHHVTGVDVSAVAIAAARAKAAAAGLDVRFAVHDVTAAPPPGGPFDAVVDSGLLHSLHRLGGDAAARYLALLPGLTAPGATVVVLAISPHGEHGWGVTEPELRAAFAPPAWEHTRVEPVAVAAQDGGRPLRLPGHLLRTVRGPG